MTSKNVPLVSFIVPIHNSESTVIDSIQSILQQSYENLEIVVIDDASKDNGYKLVEQFDDPRIKLHKQDHQGVTKTRENAIALCEGDFIAILDSDDIAYPTRVEKQMKELLNKPNLGLIGAEATFIDINSVVTGQSNFYRPSQTYQQELALKKTGFIHSSIIYRKCTISKVGGFDPFFKKAEDLDLILRISEHSEIAMLKEPLVKYRRHQSSVSHATGDYGREIWYYGAVATFNHFCRRAHEQPLAAHNISDFNQIFEKSSYNQNIKLRVEASSLIQKIRISKKIGHITKLIRYALRHPNIFIFNQDRAFLDFATKGLTHLNRPEALKLLLSK